MTLTLFSEMGRCHPCHLRGSGTYRRVIDDDELWQQKIKHEYHLVRGAAHVDASMGEHFD